MPLRSGCRSSRERWLRILVCCWGYGNSGRLGYGTADNVGDDETPGSVGSVPLDGNVEQITLGLAHTCALMDSRDVYCWGRGAFGAPGYGNASNLQSPRDAPVKLDGPIASLGAGVEHTCAVIEDGTARCWGRGAQGRLGTGGIANVGLG